MRFAGVLAIDTETLVRALERSGQSDIVTRTHPELDLTNQDAVEAFFAAERPRQVYLAAAKVGGILANNAYLTEFIYRNLLIDANVIHAAFRHGAERLLSLGSSCIYPPPRLAAQPMCEEALLTGPLEPTNEPYAIAKIAGIKLCESYNRQHGTDFRSLNVSPVRRSIAPNDGRPRRPGQAALSLDRSPCIGHRSGGRLDRAQRCYPPHHGAQGQPGRGETTDQVTSMRDEYDFSNTKPAAEIPALARRKAHNRDKTRITIIIDTEVFEASRDRADALGKPYQPMINAGLHDYLVGERGENLEATRRRVIREEPRPSAEV